MVSVNYTVAIRNTSSDVFNQVCSCAKNVVKDQEEDLEENITQDEPVSVGEACRNTTEKSMGRRAFRGLRVGTWNFSGLCSSRKQMEVSEVLVQNNIDVLAGQESWEMEGKVFEVKGYKWFGKPRAGVSKSKRGEGGVGFLVRDSVVNGVEIIKNTQYEQSMWLRVKGERGRSAVFLGCVYLPTTCENSSTLEASYDKLREDVLRFREKGQVVLLGDFNARVGQSVDVDDVIGPLGEETCNSSGNKLMSFLNEVEMVICNGREFCVEPNWTRVRASLNQRSITDYIVTDRCLMQASKGVWVDTTDVGISDHYLVWMEIGRRVRRRKQRRRVI